MPLYDFKCDVCLKEFEGYSTVEDKGEVNCAFCGGATHTLITIRSKPLFYEGYDEHLDAYITGPEQRRKVMKAKDIEEISRSEAGRLNQFKGKRKRKTVKDVFKRPVYELS